MSRVGPAKTVTVVCVCKRENPSCVICAGTGTVTHLACKRCGGTGKTGGQCLDCRGQGWRELDWDPDW